MCYSGNQRVGYFLIKNLLTNIGYQVLTVSCNNFGFKLSTKWVKISGSNEGVNSFVTFEQRMLLTN